MVIQLWYPAEPTQKAPARYLEEKGLGEALVRANYYGIDTTALKQWTTLRTHSRFFAPVIPGKHPMITFSVGSGVARANYTTIAEEMASHGYIFALVESALAGTMLVRGQLVADTAGVFGTPAGHRAGVAAWSRDISFALDEFQRKDPFDDIASLMKSIDWSRIGTAGHSSGGLVAIATCEADARVRACVNLDGGIASPDREPMADFVSKGTTKPTMLIRSQPIYSDADFAKRGLTREQWEKRAEGGRVAFDAFVARARAPFWRASVAGTGHMSFSDAPFVMPSTISRFGGKIIDPKRGLLVITSVMRAFFDQELGGKSDDLAKLSTRYPEVTIERLSQTP
jgi:pimeloyl-ACP methyl ester carboxylesterase